MRIQAWALVRLMVTPVFRILTGSIIRQCEMGQKNSAGGEVGPPRELLLLRSSPTCLLSCFLSPALQPHISVSMPSLLGRFILALCTYRLIIASMGMCTHWLKQGFKLAT